MRRLLPILVLIVCAGCTLGRGTSTFPPAAEMSAHPPFSMEDDGSDHRMLVANGLSETITQIERTHGSWTVTPDILPTGQSPNQMVLRGNLCYVVNSLSNSIQIIDVEALAIVREISTGEGTNPMWLGFVANETAMVSCYLTDEVLIVNLKPDAPLDECVVARIAMPPPEDLPHDTGKFTRAAPGGIVVVGERCFVACANLSMMHLAGGPGLLVEIDIPNESIDATYTLAGRDTTGVLHSSRFPDRLVVVSAGDYEPGKGFLGNGLIESFDLVTNRVFQTIEVEGAPLNGVVGPDDVLFLENASSGAVLRVDLRAAKALRSFKLPETGLPLSFASALLPLPGMLCATDFNADRMYLIDPISGDILAELATGDGPDAIALVY